MLIFIYCADRPGAAAVRARTRLQHLEYMLANRDKLVFGGLLFPALPEPSVGSIFVLKLPTMEAAEDFLAREPYHQAGVFDSVVMRTFRQMWPEPAPGILEGELRLERMRQQL
jgi:uncharacterized protein